MSTSHPYYPQNAILSGEIYTPNTSSVANLIISFGAAWTVLLLTTLLAIRKYNSQLKITNQALVLWFVLSGSIHLFFEGYFITNHKSIASRSDFFAELWKEYALSDSRYLTSDPFLLSIETWTVLFISPLCFLTAYSIATSSPYTHPLKGLVSIMHCYGNILYCSTSLLEEGKSGIVYYRPEWFYFWVYFVGMNGIWFVVPGWCLYDSIVKTADCFRAQSQLSVDKANGRAKQS